MKLCFAFPFLFFVLLFSCKKKDEIPPYIQISAPAEHSNFNVLDTISVAGTISDNQQLEYIKISLLNENNISAATAVTLFPEGNEYLLNREFVIDNILLESGNYRLLITASDGTNETRKYIAVTLNEVPKVLTGILIVETQSTNSATVKKINPDLSVQQIVYAAGDFSSAVASSKSQAFYMAGSATGALRAFEMQNNTEQWNIAANPLSGAPYFSALFEDDGLLYVSFHEGLLKVFDKNKTEKLQIVVNGYNFYSCCKIDNLLFSEQKLTGTSARRMTVYNALNAEELQNVPLDMEIVDCKKRNSNNILVFGNSGTQGYMKNYVVSDNGFWEPHTLPSGKVLSAERINDNTFLVGHESGVYKYTYNPNSLTAWLPGVAASFIRYEVLSNTIILSENNLVKIYNYNNAALLNSVSVSSEIKSLSLLYNRQ